MSAALVLPLVWACESQPEFRASQLQPAPVPEQVPRPAVHPGTAFYRRYTEALLRRYMRMSLEVGRTPSLLGREMFRAKVTSYRVQSFEDVVIFVHDMERAIAQLKPRHQEIVARMALQEYTVLETAALLGIPAMAVVRRYRHALDRLTPILLTTGMLERLR
jgi:DNA-directed RNA polymerase specialized sigma24 family protein